MILQPFLDSYILYSDEVINFFGFSPTTIIRIIFITLLGIIVFFDKENEKTRKPLIIYGITMIIYILLHHIIGTSINDNLIDSKFKYNLFEELFYIIRMLLPILTGYITYCLNLTKKEFKTIIMYSSTILASIILILNIFNLSLTSYFNNTIQGNIFDWHNKEIDDQLLASKGWFNSANQIGGLMIIFLPLVTYFTLKELKLKQLISLLLLIISTFCLGTRTTFLGTLLILIASFILFYVSKIFSKKKLLIKEIVFTCMIIIITLITFKEAPLVNCDNNNFSCIADFNNLINGISNKNKDLINIDYDGSYVCDFLDKTSTADKYYKDIYLCENNLEFWQKYAENKVYTKIDNRVMEDIITKDVYNKINNKQINLLGMSRSRFLSAELYLEKDIYVHYYTVGIIGIILFIFPYIIACLYKGINALIKNELNYYQCALILSILFPILISTKTGHILDELIVTMYLGLATGYLLSYKPSKKTKNLSCKKNSKKKVLFVVDERKMGGISILLKDMLEIFDYNKYQIDILVLHNNGDCLEDINKNVNLIYGTSFFDTIDYSLKEVIASKNIVQILKKLYLIFLMKTCLIKFKISEEREKIFKKDNYDIEIAFKDGFTAIFTAYGKSKKKLHWLHYEYKKLNANANYPHLFNNILKTFDKIIAVSKGVMDDFNEIYHLEDKTIVINNLVDENKIITKSKEEIKQDLSKDKINIVSVGRLHIQKGYDRLIEATSRLDKNEQEQINIDIYGDGPEFDNLNSLIKKYHLTNICLKGRVNNPYKYIKNYDLFILSSLYEPFGLVIVEAMTLKVPVIACANSATGNLIKNNHDGLIIENSTDGIYEGIKEIINNKKQLNIWKNNLKDYKYDNDKIIKEIKEIIK